MSEERGKRSWWKLALGGLVILTGCFVGGLWWSTRLEPDPNLIAVGAPAPDAGLLGSDGAPLDLEGVRGDRPLVLVFYRGHW